MHTHAHTHALTHTHTCRRQTGNRHSCDKDSLETVTEQVHLKGTSVKSLVFWCYTSAQGLILLSIIALRNERLCSPPHTPACLRCWRRAVRCWSCWTPPLEVPCPGGVGPEAADSPPSRCSPCTGQTAAAPSPTAPPPAAKSEPFLTTSAMILPTISPCATVVSPLVIIPIVALSATTVNTVAVSTSAVIISTVPLSATTVNLLLTTSAAIFQQSHYLPQQLTRRQLPLTYNSPTVPLSATTVNLLPTTSVMIFQQSHYLPQQLTCWCLPLSWFSSSPIVCHNS